MRAARFHGPKQPLKVEEVPVPEIGPGEVLVRVAACGVCHTDLHYTDHNVPTAKPPPVTLGHEVSGKVEKVGKDVYGFTPGDAVLVPPVISCGQCALCKEGRSNICAKMQMYGNHIDGGYAEYVKVPGRECFKLPASVPLEEACVVADAVTTAYHAVVTRGEVKSGQSVAVFGCGGIGINVAQMAAAQGATVTAVDLDANKLELAKQLGVKNVMQAEKDVDAGKRIRKELGSVDVAFECIGRPETIKQAHGAIRRGGRLMIVGYCEAPAKLAVSKIMFLEHDVRGSLGCPPGDFPKVLDMVGSGALKIDPLVTARFTLDQINEAFDKLREGKGIRNIVVMA